MKLIKVLPLVLLISFYSALVGCSLENGNSDGGLGDLSTVYVPVFNQLPDRGTRALEPEIGTTEAEIYGTMFLPKLSHFRRVTTTELTQETFSIQIFGETVLGEYENGPLSDQYTLKYYLGDDDGYIEIVIDESGAFVYKQYFLLSGFGDSSSGIDPVYFYVIHLIDAGTIDVEDGIGGYTAKGQLYYGYLGYDTESSSTIFRINDTGQATTYVRGTEAMVYGVIDPSRVLDTESVVDTDLFIANKPLIDLTGSDLFEKLDVIRSFDYERDPNNSYPVNDLYYFFEEDRYDGYYSYGLVESDSSGYPSEDTRDRETFESYSGYSFGDLGYPESEDIYQFLGDSLGLGYSLIGEGDIANWERSGDIFITPFTIEETGIYMVPSGFNILDNDLVTMGDDYFEPIGGAILELNRGTSYYMGLSEDLATDIMLGYSYLFKLE